MVNRLSDCVDVVKGWMASNRLRLNPTKTKVIWLGSRSCLQHCPKSPLLISGALITPSSQVRNLGVVIDSELFMTPHVNNLVKVCSFHLRQLRLICRSLDFDAAHALIRAFIHSRLDYCNSVLSGVPDYLLGRLQTVLNSSARLGEVKSAFLLITRSIVQGSGLGPYLYILLAKRLKTLSLMNRLVKYADDTTLVVPPNAPTAPLRWNFRI